VWARCPCQSIDHLLEDVVGLDKADAAGVLGNRRLSKRPRRAF